MAIGIRRKTPQIIERGQDLVASFNENLRPGRTYQVRDNHRCSLSDHQHMDGDLIITVFFLQVVVKTVSGSVASWPATGNVTTKPLPVMIIIIILIILVILVMIIIIMVMGW